MAGLLSEMRALVFRNYGDLSQLLLVSKFPAPAFPIPSFSGALIRVRAASVARDDLRVLSGAFEKVVQLDFPAVFGQDFSGVVEESSSSKFKPGDEVFGSTGYLYSGACADFVAVPDSFISIKPKALSFEEASCLTTAGLKAIQCLKDVKSGSTVAITGADHAEGILAKRFLLTSGCSVIAVAPKAFIATRDKEDSVTWIAEDEETEPGKGWWSQIQEKSVDFVFDAHGGKDIWERSHEILKKKGQFVTTEGDFESSATSLTSDGEAGARVHQVEKHAMSGLIEVYRRGISLFGNAPSYYRSEAMYGIPEDMTRLSALASSLDNVRLSGDPAPLENFKDALKAPTESGKVVFSL